MGVENSNIVHQLRGRQKVRQTEGEANITAQCVNIRKRATLIQGKKEKEEQCRDETEALISLIKKTAKRKSTHLLDFFNLQFLISLKPIGVFILCLCLFCVAIWLRGVRD